MSPAHQPGDDRPRGSGDRSGGSPGGLTPTEWADALHLAALQARAEAARRDRPIFTAPPADGPPPGEAAGSGPPPVEAGTGTDAPGTERSSPAPGTDTGTARSPGLPAGGGGSAAGRVPRADRKSVV